MGRPQVRAISAPLLSPSSQLFSCLPPVCPGRSSAPSTLQAGLNQPGSEAPSPVALARGRALALCAEWTRKQHHVACHRARARSSPLTGWGENPKFPWDPPPQPIIGLAFLGSHLKPKKGRLLLPERIKRSRARRKWAGEGTIPEGSLQG